MASSSSASAFLLCSAKIGKNKKEKATLKRAKYFLLIRHAPGCMVALIQEYNEWRNFLCGKGWKWFLKENNKVSRSKSPPINDYE
jgi:hypothetical protein